MLSKALQSSPRLCNPRPPPPAPDLPALPGPPAPPPASRLPPLSEALPAGRFSPTLPFGLRLPAARGPRPAVPSLGGKVGRAGEISRGKKTGGPSRRSAPPEAKPRLRPPGGKAAAARSEGEAPAAEGGGGRGGGREGKRGEAGPRWRMSRRLRSRRRSTSCCR